MNKKGTSGYELYRAPRSSFLDGIFGIFGKEGGITGPTLKAHRSNLIHKHCTKGLAKTKKQNRKGLMILRTWDCTFAGRASPQCFGLEISVAFANPAIV